MGADKSFWRDKCSHSHHHSPELLGARLGLQREKGMTGAVIGAAFSFRTALFAKKPMSAPPSSCGSGSRSHSDRAPPANTHHPLPLPINLQLTGKGKFIPFSILSWYPAFCMLDDVDYMMDIVSARTLCTQRIPRLVKVSCLAEEDSVSEVSEVRTCCLQFVMR